MKAGAFELLMIILVAVGIAYIVWIICTPDLPLWVKLLLLK